MTHSGAITTLPLAISLIEFLCPSASTIERAQDSWMKDYNVKEYSVAQGIRQNLDYRGFLLLGDERRRGDGGFGTNGAPFKVEVTDESLTANAGLVPMVGHLAESGVVIH